MARKLHDVVTITTEENIGTVRVTLREFLDHEGIKRNQLARSTGVKLETVNRYYFNRVARVELATLALFCRALQCDISDLLCYELNET